MTRMSRTGLRLLIPVALTGALSVGAPAIAGAAGSRVRIVQPVGPIVTARSVDVVVETPRSLRFFRLQVDGKTETGSMRRISAGRYAGRVSLSGSLGIRNITAQVTSTGGGRGFALRRLILARRQAGYVRLAVARRASGRLHVRLRTGPAADTVSVRLNGRDVTRVFLGSGRLVGVATLTARDGLHFGRNVLVAEAATAAGAYDRQAAVVDVARDRPLADAGRDVRALVGAVVRLSGRSSIGMLRGRLAYRWAAAGRPQGSKASLGRAASPTPTFVPDRPGRYRLRLTVQQLNRAGRTIGRAATDDVNLVAQTPSSPIGIPISTTVPNSPTSRGGVAIRFAGKAYSLPSSAAVLVTIIDPGTGAVVSSTSYGSDPGSAVLAQVAIQRASQTTPDPIVAMVADQRVAPVWDTVVKLVAGIGTSNGGNLFPAGNGWSAVGDPTTGKGVVDNAALSTNNGAITGWVQNQANLERFAFVPGGYVSYATQAAGSTKYVDVVQLPSQSGATFTSADVRAGCPQNPSSAGGFHILTFDAISMQKLSERTLTTACDGGWIEGNVEQLITSLDNVAAARSGNDDGRGAELVVLQTVGTKPIPTGYLSASTAEALGDAIAGVGGDPSSFLNLVAQNVTGLPFQGGNPPVHYALVGGAYVLPDGTKGTLGPAAEANSGTAANGSKAGRALWGTLRRGTRWAYEPATAASLPPANPDLNTVAYQKATPWPFAGTGGTVEAADQHAAFRDISNQVLQVAAPNGTYPGGSCSLAGTPIVSGSADVRQLYCDEVIQPSLQSDINNATRPSNATYSADTFRTVRSGLAKEAGWAANVFNLCRLLAAAYYDSSSQTAPIASIVSQVQNVVDPPHSSIVGSWLDVLADGLNLASAIGYFANEEEAGVAAAINYFSAIGYLANDGLSKDKFQFDANDLPTKAAERGQALAAAIQRLPAIYATDYGKLRAVQGIGFSDNTVNVTAESIALGRWAVDQLVPLVAQVHWVNSQILNQQTTPITCGLVAQYFFNQDSRATFGVGPRMYLARQAEFFASHNEPRALPKSLLNFLFNPFNLDQNGTVVSFGFPKQNFLWRMASPVAWNCRAH